MDEVSNGDWPADILTEILMKLPVKSIIRFKSVAKTWDHLFQNPSFVFQHLSNSKKNKRRLLVSRFYWNGKYETLMRLFVDEALVSYHDFRQQVPAHFADIEHFDFEVDNGLFCLLDSWNSVMALWNPATRKFRTLPQCNQNNLPSREDICNDILGFGLDPLSNDYKVIYLRSYYDSDKGMKTRHDAIYKMSTDSWRVLKEEDVHFFQHLTILGSFNNTCINGICYWLAFEDGGCYYIVAFHLSTEVFELIQSPLAETSGKAHLLSIDDRICIMYTDHELLNDGKSSNEVWMLNYEGNLTKIFKIEPVLEIKLMFGFWKKGKVLIESESRNLLLYDLQSQEFREIDNETREAGYQLSVHTYEESLVCIY